MTKKKPNPKTMKAVTPTYTVNKPSLEVVQQASVWLILYAKLHYLVPGYDRGNAKENFKRYIDYPDVVVEDKYVWPIPGHPDVGPNVQLLEVVE